MARRLRIEPLSPAHAAQLFPLLQDARIYTFLPQDPPSSLAQLAERYRRLETGAPVSSGQEWFNWVAYVRATGVPVATLQATVYPDRRASLAYIGFPSSWGKGLVTEGVAWMIEHLASGRDVSLFEAFIDTRNQRSIDLVRRLGFTLRSTISNADFFKGSDSDEHVFELRLPY